MNVKYGPDDWPYLWFGEWKETGSTNAPSVHDFILPDRPQPEDIEDILAYLSEAHSLAVAGSFTDPVTGDSFLDSVTGEYLPTGMAVRTDGEWRWNDGLVYLVRRYGLALPTGLIEAARRHNYVPPPVTHEQIRNLPVPYRPGVTLGDLNLGY